jgi:hypothetical protein
MQVRKDCYACSISFSCDYLNDCDCHTERSFIVAIAGAFLAWAERVFGAYTAHFVIMYVRDLVAATIIYYTTNSLWHLYIYKIKKDQFFPNGKVCSSLHMWIIIYVSLHVL